MTTVDIDDYICPVCAHAGHATLNTHTGEYLCGYCMIPNSYNKKRFEKDKSEEKFFKGATRILKFSKPKKYDYCSHCRKRTEHVKVNGYKMCKTCAMQSPDENY